MFILSPDMSAITVQYVSASFRLLLTWKQVCMRVSLDDLEQAKQSAGDNEQL